MTGQNLKFMHFGNSQVGSEVHHPPVAVIRGRPETRLLCQQTVYCFTRVMLCMGTAGCGWDRRGWGGGGGRREEEREEGEEEEEEGRRVRRERRGRRGRGGGRREGEDL